MANNLMANNLKATISMLKFSSNLTYPISYFKNQNSNDGMVVYPKKSLAEAEIKMLLNTKNNKWVSKKRI